MGLTGYRTWPTVDAPHRQGQSGPTQIKLELSISLVIVRNASLLWAHTQQHHTTHTSANSKMPTPSPTVTPTASHTAHSHTSRDSAGSQGNSITNRTPLPTAPPTPDTADRDASQQ